jgi:hypothetical protein
MTLQPSAATELYSLLREQRVHDERVHRDVYFLPYPARLIHLTLHIAKYAGRLVDPNVDEAGFRRTVVDAFIIGLSAAELLRLDVLTAIANAGADASEAPDLKDLGRRLANAPNQSKADRAWYQTQLTQHAGHLAKALESLDHLEALGYRQILELSVAGVITSSIAVSATAALSLDRAVRNRWSEFESEPLRSLYATP